jgi:mevalonate kinase
MRPTETMATGVVTRSACGKVILCGEHAVVYGRPAIALPLPGLRATARIEPAAHAFTLLAPDVNAVVEARDLATSPNPLARIAALTLDYLGQAPPHVKLTITSAIPVGANLGSGAAVSVAIARALAAWFGRDLPPEDVSALAFEVEKLHHGTPSGIDNTVIAYEQPVWFVRGHTPSPLEGEEINLPLVIADTGISTPTRVPVGDVRAAWQRAHDRIEGMFNAIASLVHLARGALERGDLQALGHVMNANHVLLQQLGVSCAELDALCDAAREAGALGAKMSGGGRGGNMIALARDAAQAERLKDALLSAGAKRVFA